MMEKIKLQVESYLFESLEEQFRAIPFYELSINEWVIYEKGQAKYLLDFNRKTKPIIQDLTAKLNGGEKLEAVIEQLGNFLGKEWSIRSDINGNEIESSQQVEEVELFLLDDLSELFIDLTFVATNRPDFEVLLSNNTWFQEESDFSCAYIDNIDNLKKMLSFVFDSEIELNELALEAEKCVLDLTPHKNKGVTIEYLENNYEAWIELSNRENSMNEYGSLIEVIGYIEQSKSKMNLLLLIEKRKHY